MREFTRVCTPVVYLPRCTSHERRVSPPRSVATAYVRVCTCVCTSCEMETSSCLLLFTSAQHMAGLIGSCFPGNFLSVHADTIFRFQIGCKKKDAHTMLAKIQQKVVGESASLRSEHHQRPGSRSHRREADRHGGGSQCLPCVCTDRSTQRRSVGMCSSMNTPCSVKPLVQLRTFQRGKPGKTKWG